MLFCSAFFSGSHRLSKSSSVGPIQAATPTPAPGATPGSLQSVNHIIFMVQENRSFDAYFGKINDYRASLGLARDADDLETELYQSRRRPVHAQLPLFISPLVASLSPRPHGWRVMATPTASIPDGERSASAGWFCSYCLRAWQLSMATLIPRACAPWAFTPRMTCPRLTGSPHNLPPQIVFTRRLPHKPRTRGSMPWPPPRKAWSIRRKIPRHNSPQRRFFSFSMPPGFPGKSIRSIARPTGN